MIDLDTMIRSRVGEAEMRTALGGAASAVQHSLDRALARAALPDRYPLLGFDEFIDINQFAAAQRIGPFVSDLAVAQKAAAILEASPGKPVFLFVITMENHGPLHLERVMPEDIDRYHASPPPSGCGDLTVYLRHLANASRMAEHLRDTLNALPDDAWLAWFGDHVPIMPTVYSRLGTPDGRTEYFVWRKGGTRPSPDRKPLRVEELGLALLRERPFQ